MMYNLSDMGRIAKHVNNRTPIKNRRITEPFLLKGLSSTKFLHNSRTKTSGQIAKLVEDLQLLLSTEVGTLFGRPDYGTRLKQYLFEPVVEIMGEQIRQEVVRAIQNSYPTMHLNEVNIELLRVSEKQPELINGNRVELQYSVNQSNLNQLISFDIMREQITGQEMRR